jgi:uncharacterized membrane protein YeaQ/YmgE (transglycosylase-associated protein family)
MTLIQVITWVIIGLMAGSLAGLVVRGRGFGFLITLLPKSIFPRVLTEPISISLLDVLAAFIGALILLFLFGLLRRRR